MSGVYGKIFRSSQAASKGYAYVLGFGVSEGADQSRSRHVSRAGLGFGHVLTTFRKYAGEVARRIKPGEDFRRA